MKTKNLLTAAVALLMAGAAQAQTNTWTSYSFVEAQGGVQLTSTNAPMDKLITPTSTHGSRRVACQLPSSITNGSM